ncbi:hypothetical protein V2J09_007071 [Rumex salicifolius]
MLQKSLSWILILLLLLPSSALSLDTFNDDVLGLIVFKAALKDPQSKLSSWTDSDDNPCKWDGVQCDPNTNRVTELTLDGFSLSGEISRGLLRLQFLQKISLSNNNFSGEISPDFSNLWSLQLINLNGNSLSGSIPGELFQQCGSLKSVSFAHNFLSGELPVSLSSCMSLESIDFSSNQLNGQLSSNLWSLSGLQSLDLSNNLFEGEIPQGFGKMYSLRAVNFAGNTFSGYLPSDIGDCPQLQSISFGENSLSGGLPKSMKKLQNCTFLSLNENLLNGEVPSWIGHLKSLENLDLSGNKFSGKIPNSLGNLAATLTALNLSSNGFIGDLPVSLKACSGLVSIDVSKNLLAGDLPNWVFDMGLHSISLSGNRFTGSINFQHPATESASNSYLTLEVLDLSSNLITGVIPSEIDAFSGLVVLNLSSNLLFGAIPPTVGRLDLIQILDLSNNRLNGSIAVEIGSAASMRELRLQSNLLTGFIPNQIGNLSSLTTLILKQNNITGKIPATIANLKDLKVADFSHNNLIGPLPKELTYLSQLQSFNISYNHLEGELPDSIFFNTIPLSSVTGNPSLCGSVVNQNCPSVHPKPIVLNPNSSISSDEGTIPPNLHKKKLMLSISSLIAIGAAAFILLGVVAITILNLRVRNPSSQHLAAPFSFSARDDFSQSPISDSEYGKLVMFAGEIDFGEGAHALLSKDREIGRGGFGTVYHTILGDGRPIAIKKLSISSLIKSRDDFEREVKTLGNAKHHNLVELQGYYWTSSLQLLITEHVSGGSLFDCLHEDSCSVSWQQRLDIITGIAKGLAHLHQMNIIHYNLKSTNVLLDSCNEPKVGDFGLARLIPMLDRYILSSKIQSALGYMAPEFACRSVKITEKCDVYGFGILLLEIVTGKKPVEYMEDDVIVLCDMVREALEDGKVDPCVDRRLLGGEFSADEVVPVIKLGLICASQVPSNRPDMAEVVNILEVIGCRRSGSERVDLD